MGQKTYIQCDQCDKKSESESLPNGWSWVADQNHDINNICFCSMHCMLIGVAKNPSILSGIQCVINTDFLIDGAKTYVEFNESAKALEEKYASAKRMTIDSKYQVAKPNISNIKPADGHKKGDNKHRRYTAEEKRIMLEHTTFDAAYAALSAANPNTTYVRSRVYATWYGNHNSLKHASTISKEELREFDVVKRNQKPISETELKPTIPKPMTIENKTKIRNYLYYSDFQLPWLEKILGQPYVKNIDCMEIMKNEWAYQKRTAASTMCTSKHEVPDAAFLRFEGYYSIWLSETSLATVSSAIHSNGSIDNLQETE